MFVLLALLFILMYIFYVGACVAKQSMSVLLNYLDCVMPATKLYYAHPKPQLKSICLQGK